MELLRKKFFRKSEGKNWKNEKMLGAPAILLGAPAILLGAPSNTLF